MADFSQLLSTAQAQPDARNQASDPITKMLVSQTPTTQDIFRSLNASSGQSVGRPQSTFGEILNQVKGARIKEAMAAKQIEQTDRGLAIREEELNITREKRQMDAVKQASAAYGKALDEFDPAGQLKIFRAMGQSQDEFSPTETDPIKARMDVFRHAEEAGVQATAKGDTVMEKKIQMFKEMGYSHALAVKAATGVLKPTYDPISRKLFLVDVLGGTAIEPDLGTSAQTPTEPKEKKKAPPVDFTLGTGKSGFVGWGVNKLSEIMLGKQLAPETDKAIKGLERLQFQTQTAFRPTSFRPTNYLMEQVAKQTVQPGSIFTGDQDAYHQMQTVTEMITNEVEKLNDIIVNQGLYQPKQVAEARQNKLEMENLRNQYDVILKSFEKAFSSGSTQTTPDDEALFKKYGVPAQ